MGVNESMKYELNGFRLLDIKFDESQTRKMSVPKVVNMGDRSCLDGLGCNATKMATGCVLYRKGGGEANHKSE